MLNCESFPSSISHIPFPRCIYLCLFPVCSPPLLKESSPLSDRTKNSTSGAVNSTGQATRPSPGLIVHRSHPNDTRTVTSTHHWPLRDSRSSFSPPYSTGSSIARRRPFPIVHLGANVRADLPSALDAAGLSLRLPPSPLSKTYFDTLILSFQTHNHFLVPHYF